MLHNLILYVTQFCHAMQSPISTSRFRRKHAVDEQWAGIENPNKNLENIAVMQVEKSSLMDTSSSRIKGSTGLTVGPQTSGNHLLFLEYRIR